MFVKSKMDYAAPAWQPWLSETSEKALDRVQNKALRLVTGQLKTTPTEALRYETRTDHYSTYTRRTCLKSVEMAKQLPDSHPRRKALDQAVKPKISRRSWFRMGTSLADHLPRKRESMLNQSDKSLPMWDQLRNRNPDRIENSEEQKYRPSKSYVKLQRM